MKNAASLILAIGLLVCVGSCGAAPGFLDVPLTWGVAVNPAGSHVYVANYRDNTVSVIDTGNNTVVGTTAVGRGPVAFGKFIIDHR